MTDRSGNEYQVLTRRESKSGSVMSKHPKPCAGRVRVPAQPCTAGPQGSQAVGATGKEMAQGAPRVKKLAIVGLARGKHLAPVDGLTKLMNLGVAPIYFLRAKEWRVKNKREFPRQKIALAFPRGDYHASSFDWMLSFGILEGYKHIELFGVDLGPTDAGEPISARPCLEYWCGVAAGKGVTVISHSPSLFQIFNYQRATTPYHYDDTWRLIEDRKKQ